MKHKRQMNTYDISWLDVNYWTNPIQNSTRLVRHNDRNFNIISMEQIYKSTIHSKGKESVMDQAGQLLYLTTSIIFRQYTNLSLFRLVF